MHPVITAEGFSKVRALKHIRNSSKRNKSTLYCLLTSKNKI